MTATLPSSLGLENLRAQLRKARERALRPPPKLTLSEWTERHFRLSPESSAETGRFRPWGFQIGMLDAVTDPHNEQITVIKSARVGYALATDTPIATPSGWSTMGDLAPGDRVFDERGEPCTVTTKSPVYADHDCYVVRFDDGSEITADADHQWFVESERCFEYLKGERGSGVIGRPKPGQSATFSGVVATREMARLTRTPRGRTALAIPNGAALETPEADLPIPPYTLGLWLGDGNRKSGRITQHRPDVETADYIREEGVKASVRYIDERYPNNATIFLEVPDNGKPISGITPRLYQLGLTRQKHVPAAYLRASFGQRLALLRGLMDSDGTVGKNGRAEFSNTNIHLARAVYELACSLGMKAFWRERKPQRAHYQAQYRVGFRADPEINPFRLRRKAERVKQPEKPSINYRRRVVAVEPVASVPVQCIQVDSPSRLYLAGRQMVPTHNTKVINAAVGFFIHQDPSPVLVVQPRAEDADDYSKTEIAPMLRDCPVLADLVGAVKNKDPNFTIRRKVFPNGASLSLLSAHSPNEFRRVTARVVAFDEVDAYEQSTAEGDPIDLGVRRTTSFWNRKIIQGSTPTVKGASRIEKAWAESDQRYYYVPCPHCGTYQTLAFGADKPYGLRWPHDAEGNPKPEAAYYRCVEGCTIEERHKPWMIEQGEWRAHKPENAGHAGFHISALYSLFWNARWSVIAREFLERKDDPGRLQTFVNTMLGETWELPAEHELDEDYLMARREVYPAEVPDGVALLTLAADTQDDRLEVEVMGWGYDEESWSIAHYVLIGDPEANEVWEQLDAIRLRSWASADGRQLRVEAGCVDTGGHHTEAAYRYCVPRMAQRIYPIKGQSRPGGQRSQVFPYKPTRRTKGKVPLYIVDVDAAKDAVVPRLSKTEPGPGYCHFPAHYEAEYFRQLTAERPVLERDRNGNRVRRWKLRASRRNEALDLRVYNYAALSALRNLGFKLNEHAARVGATRPQEREPVMWARSAEQAEQAPPPIPDPAERPVPRSRRGKRRRIRARMTL
ncbi:MAG: terminase gpA endonuclease subunit [Halorhodospira sp.]